MEIKTLFFLFFIKENKKQIKLHIFQSYSFNKKDKKNQSFNEKDTEIHKKITQINNKKWQCNT